MPIFTVANEQVNIYYKIIMLQEVMQRAHYSPVQPVSPEVFPDLARKSDMFPSGLLIARYPVVEPGKFAAGVVPDAGARSDLLVTPHDKLSVLPGAHLWQMLSTVGMVAALGPGAIEGLRAHFMRATEWNLPERVVSGDALIVCATVLDWNVNAGVVRGMVYRGREVIAGGNITFAVDGKTSLSS